MWFSLGEAWCCDRTKILQRMSTRPDSAAHQSIPIISWCKVMSFGLSSGLSSNSGTKVTFMGVLAPSAIDHLLLSEIEAFTVLTAARMHSSPVIAQQGSPSIDFFCDFAPRCILGVSILSFLNLTVPPFRPSNTSLGSVQMARMSSTWHNMHSQCSEPSGLMAGQSQTSGSAVEDAKFISSSFLATKDLNAALADLRPHNAPTTVNVSPFLWPNSSPAIE